MHHGKPCRYCGGTLRYSSRDCVPCQKAKRAAWRAANPEKHKAECREWTARNLQYKRMKEREWRIENNEHFKAGQRKWKEANPEHVKAYQRQYSTSEARAARRARTSSSRG